MQDRREADVLIVGAGPVGIEMAVALKRAGISYLHLDGSQVGSTIAWYAPQTHFFSSPERIAIAGVPLQTLDQTKATREEYLAYLRAVVMQFDLIIETHQRVTSVDRRPDGRFDISSRQGARERYWRAGRVVLAIGDMHSPRRVGVPGEDLPHVSHYFEDPHVYFRRRGVIVGGKNSAVEAAIRCVRVGANVTLAHRSKALDSARIKFWLFPEIQGLVRDGRMTLLSKTEVREITPSGVLLERSTETGSELLEVEAGFVLLLTGYEQDPKLFLEAGVRLAGPGRKPSFDENTMETNVPGLFVAGTASAGTQMGGVKEFIETSHVHVDRIMAVLTGSRPPAAPAPFEMPES